MPTNNKQGTQPKKQYGWSGIMDNGGRLHLALYCKNLGSQEVNRILGESIASATLKMFEKGYIPLQTVLMSSREIAQRYGSSRQYWEKLLREGKIPYYQTAAGRITIDLFVVGYLRNKSDVNQYVIWQKNVVKQVKKAPKAQYFECPKCDEKQLSIGNNDIEINGVCRAGCGFEFTTTVPK